MKEICEEWRREMRAVRWERRFMIATICALVGIKLFM